MAGFLGRIFHDYTQRIINRFIDLKNFVFSGGVVVIFGLISIWISIFLYVAFYYAYMPSVLHVRPVHLQFKPCEEVKGICSFPTAHVQLTKKQQILMIGQQYKIYLHLEMPESPANQKLGMFMVCTHLEDKAGTLITNSCRSAMLHYRSPVLHVLHTLLFFPLMILGSTEEKQNVVVELFSNYEEDPVHPATDIFVEVQSRHVEIYSAEIRVAAHLMGLRHLMFHWPTFSAGVGVVSIMFFLAVLIVLSWCHHVLRTEFRDRSHAGGGDWASERIKEEEEEEDYDDDDDDDADFLKGEKEGTGHSPSAAELLESSAEDEQEGVSSKTEEHSAEVETLK
ncbi:hypothetical protein J437_LFUL016857 [Ladona fulva]|uniref:Seipin n=1 Tax=Ladona fulva TaxID=123851 RepID=A0A8K0KQS5_LADFU|nr:hypothetical protein J437_LFUL016857 [Ladona fulva]